MNVVPEIPNLRHLRMLQTIGRTHGIGSTARELNTSQPAVSLALASLEAEFGAAIFERGVTGCFPTAVGRQVLLRVDRAFDALEFAVRKVTDTGECANRATPAVERLITGTQIRALIAASEPSGVDSLAARIGVSSKSLQRSARSVENALGARLFDRASSGHTCNRAGAQLAQQFRFAARELELARDEIRLAANDDEVDVVVGVLPISGSYELAQATLAFTSRRRARVKIVTGEYESLLEDLSNCRIDMIYGLARCPDWATGVAKEELFEDSYCVVVRPKHPLANLPTVTVEDLTAYDWIAPPEGMPRRKRIEELFVDAARKPRFRIETRSLAACRALLMDSDLITVMTRSEIESDLRLGLLRRLKGLSLKPSPPKGIATRLGWLPTSAHDEFLRILRQVTSDIHAPTHAIG